MSSNNDYEQLKRRNRRRLAGAVVMVVIASAVLLSVMNRRSAETIPTPDVSVNSTASAPASEDRKGSASMPVVAAPGPVLASGAGQTNVSASTEKVSATEASAVSASAASSNKVSLNQAHSASTANQHMTMPVPVAVPEQKPVQAMVGARPSLPAKPVESAPAIAEKNKIIKNVPQNPTVPVVKPATVEVTKNNRPLTPATTKPVVQEAAHKAPNASTLKPVIQEAAKTHKTPIAAPTKPAAQEAVKNHKAPIVTSTKPVAQEAAKNDKTPVLSTPKPTTQAVSKIRQTQAAPATKPATTEVAKTHTEVKKTTTVTKNTVTAPVKKTNEKAVVNDTKKDQVPAAVVAKPQGLAKPTESVSANTNKTNAEKGKKVSNTHQPVVPPKSKKVVEADAKPKEAKKTETADKGVEKALPKKTADKSATTPAKKATAPSKSASSTTAQPTSSNNKQTDTKSSKTAPLTPQQILNNKAAGVVAAKTGTQTNRAHDQTQHTNNSNTNRLLIQIGAYTTDAQAQAVKKKLSAAGVQVNVTPSQTSRGTLYRVRTGLYTNRAEAEQQLNKIHAAGVDGLMMTQ